MAQTAYNIYPSVGYPGLLVPGGNTDCVSGVDTAEVVAFGRLVVKGGSTDDGVRLPAASSDVTGKAIGVALHETKMPLLVGGVSQYELNDVMSIMKHGRCWVQVEEAVNAGDIPFVRFATGSFATLGAFRKSADTASAVALPLSRYLTTAGINGIALLEIDLI